MNEADWVKIAADILSVSEHRIRLTWTKIEMQGKNDLYDFESIADFVTLLKKHI